MPAREKYVALVIGLAITSMVACQKAETPGGEGQKSASVAPTPDTNPPFGILNTPGEGETVPNKSWCTGWALDDSGIFQITGVADNGEQRPAKIGQPFPGVKEAHPNLPDNDTAGFIFQIPDLPPGPHTVTVEVVAKDGGKTVLTRHFTVQ